MDNSTIKDAKNALSEAQKAEIIELWKQANAFTDIEISHDRLKEIFVIALHENGKIIAVSTYYQDINPILNLNLYFIRAFVAESSRQFKFGTAIIIFVFYGFHRDVSMACVRYFSQAKIAI